ncbi:hypothetical protein PENTCL1PPCAC_16357 [Pristionchus entomophagus]|uniref:G protein-coupled receptor n=1 Tax=Pristionchus entomophagus TaxID=358040 RepID=A0AAV5TIL5_9BILA|nr:hypothetical protein PENTCL1PPCAC_16357 [Pristionchus entomophagus]
MIYEEQKARIRSIDNLSLVYRSPSIIVDYRTRRSVSLRLIISIIRIVVVFMFLLLLQCLSLFSILFLLISSSPTGSSRLSNSFLRGEGSHQLSQTSTLPRLPETVCLQQQVGGGVRRVVIEHQIEVLK